MTKKPEKPKKPAPNKKLPRKQAKKTGPAKQPFAELPECLRPNRIGRPSKYDPSFCDLVLELGAQGKSKAQMAAAIGVDRETLDNWKKAHPEFSRAVKAALDLSLAWWEDVGQHNLTRMGFNNPAFIFQVCNRFKNDYQQRVTVSGNPDQPLVTRIERRVIHARKP